METSLTDPEMRAWLTDALLNYFPLVMLVIVLLFIALGARR